MCKARLGLARVSVVRGEGPAAGSPAIDDYIRSLEPISDYLTKWSGLVSCTAVVWSPACMFVCSGSESNIKSSSMPSNASWLIVAWSIPRFLPCGITSKEVCVNMWCCCGQV